MTLQILFLSYGIEFHTLNLSVFCRYLLFDTSESLIFKLFGLFKFGSKFDQIWSNLTFLHSFSFRFLFSFTLYLLNPNYLDLIHAFNNVCCHIWFSKVSLLGVQNQVRNNLFFVFSIWLILILCRQEEDHVYIGRCTRLIGLFLRVPHFGGLSFLLMLFILPETLHSPFLDLVKPPRHYYGFDLGIYSWWYEGSSNSSTRLCFADHSFGKLIFSCTKTLFCGRSRWSYSSDHLSRIGLSPSRDRYSIRSWMERYCFSWPWDLLWRPLHSRQS